MPIVHIPEFEKYKEQGYKGTFVGGCIKRGDGSRFRARAHAHNYKSCLNFGWICVLSKKRLYKTSGLPKRPSIILIHEIAHILTPGHGHDDIWRAKVRKLNGALPKRYLKQPRIKNKIKKFGNPILASKNKTNKVFWSLPNTSKIISHNKTNENKFKIYDSLDALKNKGWNIIIN